MPPKFYPGLHHCAPARHFERVCLSIHTLKTRRKPIDCADVLVDSGAFTKLATHGCYPEPVEVYARQLWRLHRDKVVNITAAVAQDYMCEPFMLAKTGLTVIDHQRLTIERYDALMACRLPFPIMPVLQGFAPADYVEHLRQYGDRLKFGLWVGVGSVCKRNGSPRQVWAVLDAIHRVRPDLKLHGFGVKITSLRNEQIRELLFSADSAAWSFAARKEGRSPNDWREALSFVQKIAKASEPPAQLRLAV